MKTTKILYWVFTILITGFIGLTSIEYVMSTPNIVNIIHTMMGYPEYIIPFLGWAKILGCLTILLPLPARLKEWAYAGLAFDLIGATYSALALGDTTGGWTFMILLLAILALSYFYYHKIRKTKTAATAYSPVVA